MKHHGMYDESPRIASDEQGKKSVKKMDKEAGEGKEKGVKEEGFDEDGQHIERLMQHHKHMHEKMRMHEKHEMEHHHHKGNKAELHKRHQAEFKEMNSAHESEMKSMHTKHEKSPGMTSGAPGDTGEPAEKIVGKGKTL